MKIKNHKPYKLYHGASVTVTKMLAFIIIRNLSQGPLIQVPSIMTIVREEDAKKNDCLGCPEMLC